MGGALPPLPQYAFMAWYSGGAQGQLYLSYPYVHIYVIKILKEEFIICFTRLYLFPFPGGHVFEELSRNPGMLFRNSKEVTSVEWGQFKIFHCYLCATRH